jgi:hypothetical protein
MGQLVTRRAFDPYDDPELPTLEEEQAYDDAREAAKEGGRDCYRRHFWREALVADFPPNSFGPVGRVEDLPDDDPF